MGTIFMACFLCIMSRFLYINEFGYVWEVEWDAANPKALLFYA